jgi:hypothetical protein
MHQEHAECAGRHDGACGRCSATGEHRHRGDPGKCHQRSRRVADRGVSSGGGRQFMRAAGAAAVFPTGTPLDAVVAGIGALTSVKGAL